MANVDITSVCPQLKKQVVKTSSGSEVVSYNSDLGDGGPILTLIHGYPSSAYSYVVNLYAKKSGVLMGALPPALADKVSLFVPELPGYGISTPQEDNSKRAIGATILEALQKSFNISESSPRKVILGGHDRGGRIVHRLAVDKDRYPALHILGVVMLDIVPTRAQFAAFGNPGSSVSYYHWPFLANVEVSVKMLKAYGGGQWARDAQYRISGKNEEGIKRLEAHGAVGVYEAQFDKEETLVYTAKDYEAGATIDCQQQEEDQKAGRKIEVPTLVMFSKSNLGARLDVESIWKDWIKPGVPYQGIGVGNNYGHYLTEEAYDVVLEQLVPFVQKLT